MHQSEPTRLHCPVCGAALDRQESSNAIHRCGPCNRSFRDVCGIPDFSHDAGFYWGEVDRETVAALLDPDRSIETYIRRDLPREDEPLAAYLKQYVFDVKRAGWKYWLALHSDGRILDFGCGWGALSLSLAPHCAELWVTDAIAERVAITLKRAREHNYRHVYGCASSGWPRLPFADESFDTVILNGVLEWIPASIKGDPLEIQRAFLMEVSRVLRPSGQLALGIENRFGAGYFMGKREEHTKLKYVSLLPRPLGRRYHRLAIKAEYRALTHGRLALSRMLKTSGMRDARFLCPYPDYREFDRVLDLDDRHQIAAAFEPRTRSGKIKAFIARNSGIIKWLANSFVVVATKPGTLPKRGFYERLLDRHEASDVSHGVRWLLESYRLTPAGNVLIQFRAAAGSDRRLLTLPVDEKAACRLERAIANRLRLRKMLTESMMLPMASGVFEKVPYIIEPFFQGRKADDPFLTIGEQKARETLADFQNRISYTRQAFRAETFFGESVTAAFLRECFGSDAIPATLTAFYRGNHETLTGPIHGDFHAGNVLVHPDTGETRVIDWDLATMTGLPLWDTLNLWTHSRYEETRDWAASLRMAWNAMRHGEQGSRLHNYVRKYEPTTTDLAIGCLTFPLWQWHNKMEYGDGRGHLITKGLTPVLKDLIGDLR